MKSTKSDSYVFVIKTDSYAGNFERETCAYVTGQVGECGVGDQYEEEFKEQFPELAETFSDYVEQRATGDYGTRRPCEIWNGPDCNSIGIFFYKVPTREMTEFMKERAIEFSQMKKGFGQDNFKVLGFQLIKEVVSVSYEDIPI